MNNYNEIEQEQRKHLCKIFEAAVEAVDPYMSVQDHVKLVGDILQVDGKAYDIKNKKILILGAGKGVAPMALAMEYILGKRISSGLVVTKYEHALPLKYIKILEASHPVPDNAGVVATKAMLELAAKACEQTIIICLFTGGASSLTPAPAKGLSLENVQEVTNLLLQSGANIHEINTLRKHLSSFSGGKLASIARPAKVISLIISDVIGDALDVIASAPTVLDNSTIKQCFEIIEKYSLSKLLPKQVLTYLKNYQQGTTDEYLEHEHKIFSHVQNVLIANNAKALSSAFACAKGLGFSPYVMPEPMQGEARVQAVNLVNYAKSIADKLPVCILAGGETTVTIAGSGKGGRSQEMALSAALALEGVDNIACLFAGTDGTDGPTDAAGGFALASSAKRLQDRCNPQELLADNNSYTALQLSGDLFITGPTRTNVMDVAILLVYA